MTAYQRQWLDCRDIANRCMVQFLGVDSAIAVMFGCIAIQCAIQGGEWE